MFVIVFMAIVSLGCLFFVVRWTLAPPNGPLDGTVRVLVATVAGGLIAFWVVAASIAPQLKDDAERNGLASIAPSEEEARTFIKDVELSAPIGIEIAAGIGAGAGFFIALASVGSYRRLT
jgi:hypothetical protein